MNVLFVDDEPKMLRAIERSLLSLHSDWVLYFSESAERAWDVLEHEQIDVVVSDMRMPDVDGADFLTAVSLRVPDVARLVLSGFNDERSSVRSAAAAHRFLAKPISGVDLVSEITSAAAGSQDELSRQVVYSTNFLPSPAAIVADLASALAETDVAFEDVDNIVRQDPALTARVLQLGNSAFFGERSSMSSVRQCLQKLSIDTLSYLVETQNLVETNAASGAGMDALVSRIQDHASASAETGQLSMPDRPEIGYLAGLLHVTGLLTYAHHGVDASNDHTNGTCSSANDRELGTLLLIVWGVPSEIVEAAAAFSCNSLI
jgi:HD-like signal output (HDOD) protein